MLLALSTAKRAQTLSQIRLTNVKKVANGLEIRVPDILKMFGPGRYQPSLQFPIFKDRLWMIED